MMLWYGVAPTWRILLLPVFTGAAFLAACGFGFWLAALNVEYRDFRYVIPFVMQFGLYVSPVGFSSTVVPGKWRLLYSINPMVGVIDGFRWAITGVGSLMDWSGFAVSLSLIVVVAVTGLRYFQRTERAFADII
jgi:lipopolysaccharide transport system permease protein